MEPFHPLMLDALGHYCDAVDEGVYREGPCINGMVRRHRAYLDWSQDPERFPYVYVPQLGQAFANWCATMQWVQGEDFTGKPALLLPWERMVSDYFFGWRRLVRSDEGGWEIANSRMVRDVGVGVAKGAGKSSWLELMIAFMMACDGAVGADFGVFAVRQLTATKRLRKVKQMLEASGRIADWNVSHPNPATIVIEYRPNGNTARSFSAIGETGATDGNRTRLTALDESASIKDSVRFDELVSGGTATDSKTAVISTSTPGKTCHGFGFKRWVYHVTQAQLPPEEAAVSCAPFMYVMDADAQKIVVQAMRGRTSFEDGDANWQSPEMVKALDGRNPERAVWESIRQCSPALTDESDKGGTQIWSNIRAELLAARGKGKEAVAEALRAFACMWPQAAGVWLNAAAWAEMSRAPREALQGHQRAVWAFYCGNEKRAASLAIYYPDARYLEVKVYASREAVAKIDKEQQMPDRWAGWVAEGHVEVDGDGEVLTFKAMERDLVALHRRHRVKKGVYHDVAVGSIMARLIGERRLGKNVSRIAPTARAYGAGATALVQALAGAMELRHDGNPAVHDSIRTIHHETNPKTGAVMPRRGGDLDRHEPAMAIMAALAAGVALRRRVSGKTAPSAAPAAPYSGRPSAARATVGRRQRR
jgi:phage terminase large subunit-like protein